MDRSTNSRATGGLRTTSIRVSNPITTTTELRITPRVGSYGNLTSWSSKSGIIVDAIKVGFPGTSKPRGRPRSRGLVAAVTRHNPTTVSSSQPEVIQRSQDVVLRVEDLTGLISGCQSSTHQTKQAKTTH
jgi:hypothetical protein